MLIPPPPPPVPPTIPGSFTGAVLPSPGAGRFQFRLDQAGKVSVAVFLASGEMVRTLLNSSQMAAGTQTVTWDGKNDAGAALPTGNYTFKLLQTPGLSAEYLMTLQTNLPIGSNFKYKDWFSNTPPSDDRQVGIGNHEGPTAVTVDATGIYITAGVAENTAQMVKLSLDGSKRIWSANQPDVFIGRYALASMRGQLYSLLRNGYVAVQGVDEPNFPSTSVGIVGSPSTLGSRWDSLWPGDARSGGVDWVVDAPVSMAASDAGGTPQLALSYVAHNQVQWRNPSTGAILDTVAVTAPRGVAFDSQGRLLIATANGVVRTSRADKTLVPVISGLTAPYRIAVDPASGDILVAERGTDQRVKRFTAAGQNIGTYGRLGGRRDGLYVATDFRNITDISPDGAGGFYVTEHAAPRRIGRFDRTGVLVKDWYAGGIWSPYAIPEPGNPSAVWVASEHGEGEETMRLVLDLNAKTWRVHSTYRLAGLGNNLVPTEFPGIGAGINALRPRRVGGKLFLAGDSTTGQASILAVDETNWTLKAAGKMEFRQDIPGVGNYLWADANGDGLAQESEIRRFNTGIYGYQVQLLRSDENMNYFALGIAGNLLKYPVTGFSASGVPVYAPLASVYSSLPAGPILARFPSELLNAKGESDIYNSDHPLAFGPDGSIYVAASVGATAWATASNALVVKWSANGQLLWKRPVATGRYVAGQTFSPGTSMYSTFRNTVGFVRDSLVTQDFNGGNFDYDGPGITYVWDKDGLFVGGLFDKIDTSRVGSRYYNLSSENGAGAVIEEPGTSNVIYYGSTESANHVYRIKGWGGWLRLSGAVAKP